MRARWSHGLQRDTQAQVEAGLKRSPPGWMPAHAKTIPGLQRVNTTNSSLCRLTMAQFQYAVSALGTGERSVSRGGTSGWRASLMESMLGGRGDEEGQLLVDV